MNSLILRQGFDRMKAAFPPGVVIVPADLRLEALMNTASSSITFNHKTGQPANGADRVFNTEVRLDINDTFMAMEIGLFVCKPASSTSAVFDLFSYANPIEFATANVAGGLKMLFNNSALNISKEQVQYLQDFTTLRFRKAGVTQNGLGFGAASATPTVAATVVDQFNGNEDGFSPIGVDFSFSGRDSMDIEIQMPSAFPAIETNSRVVLIMRGYKAYNTSR